MKKVNIIDLSLITVILNNNINFLLTEGEGRTGEY